MKHDAKRYNSDDINFRGLIRSLEMDSMPALVDERLKAVYQELPDEVPHRQKKKRTLIKGVISSAAAVAAAVMITFGVNAVNPAFAEEMPIIGGLFKQINQHQQNVGELRETPDTERIAEHAMPVEEEEKVLATCNTDNAYAEISESYYDGVFLHSSIAVKTEMNLADYTYFLSGDLYIDNKLALSDINSHSNIRWFKSGTDEYIADMASVIPREYRTKADVQIRYDLQIKKPMAEMTESAVVPDITLEFTAKYDPSESVYIETDAEQNGYKIFSFYTSPAGTEIHYEKPWDGYYERFESVYKQNGKASSVFGNGGRVAEEIPDNENGTVEMWGWFAGMKASDKEVTLRSEGGEDNTIISEFTIDLVNKTITPSEHWKDKTSPYYFCEAAERAEQKIFASYRADDSTLEKLESGYAVEFLTSNGNHKSIYLSLATIEPYQDLYVELYRDGKILGTGMTKEGNEWGSLFSSFADYDYSEIYDVKFLDNGEGWLYNGASVKREGDFIGRLNIQQLPDIDYTELFIGDEVTVKVYKAGTKELLHEETVTLELPAGKQAGEGQTLVKLRGAGYAIVDNDDLD